MARDSKKPKGTLSEYDKITSAISQIDQKVAFMNGIDDFKLNVSVYMKDANDDTDRQTFFQPIFSKIPMTPALKSAILEAIEDMTDNLHTRALHEMKHVYENKVKKLREKK